MWIILVFTKIVIANGLFPIILKNNVALPTRTKKMALQFMFCFLFAVIVSFTLSPLTFSPATWIILAIGFVNGLAAFAQWKAVDISLSKTSLFTFWDDIIAMGLSYFILNERHYLSPGWYIGVSLSLAAVILFAIHSYRKKADGQHKKLSTKFFWYVGFYSVIWGGATFSMRYFGVAHVSGGSFLVPWYAGAFVAALLIMLFYKEDKANTKIRPRNVGIMFVLALLVFISLALGYLIFQTTPQNIAQPFFLVGEMILPAFIGLYLFSERKGLDMWEKLFFVMAFIGAIIIAINAY
jgi:hypothetical protein